MQTDHQTSTFWRADFTLVQRDKRHEHANPKAHDEPAHDEHWNIHAGRHDGCADDADNAPELNTALPPKLLSRPHVESATESASGGVHAIDRSEDNIRVRRLGRKVVVRIPCWRTDQGR